MGTSLLSKYKRNPSPSGYGNPIVRFWKRVDKDGPIHPVHGQCWIWTGSCFGSGYGQFYTVTKNYRAHRVSWEIHFGSVPNGLNVLHRCDNRICVNPKHLFLGDDNDNIQDMVNKERHPRGETNGKHVLTEELVRYIRERYRKYSSADGSYAIANDLGVCQYTVMCVVQGKSWKHVV